MDAEDPKLTDNDERELTKFKEYLRLCSAAVDAGCDTREAALAIYPYLYGEDI